MKKQILTSIKTIGILAFMLVAIAPALAWKEPFQATVVPENAHAVMEMINTDCAKMYPAGSTLPYGLFPVTPRDRCMDMQGKNGSFITEGFLKAGTRLGWSTIGSVVSESSMATPGTGFFYKVFAPGINAQVSTSADTDVAIPLSIDMNDGGAGTTSSATSAIDILPDANFCNTRGSILVDTPAVQVWSTKRDAVADLSGQGIQLSGGNPQPGMILVSTDADGNAIWATPTLSSDGTSVVFNYGTSPVVTGQASCN